MWASGIITADAVYWSEATSTWESVAELLKPPPSIAAEKEPAIPPLPPAGSNENTAMWDSAKPRPWRRLWARLLDLQILGGIPLLTIALICLHFFPTWPFPNAGFVSGLIALEPLFLSKFGTTPGKWLLGITLKKPDGNNLTQKEAMRRLFSVIWRCILLVFPFCAALAYRDLKKRGATKWDRKGNYVVTYSQISGQRWLAAVSLMFIFTVSSFVSMWELLATERGQPHDLFTGNVQPEGKTDDIRTKANAAADAGLQKVLTRTLSDTKTEAKEWFRKGVAYDLQGDAASALFGYQKAIELDPEFQQAWSAIGVWHLKLKQSEEAIEALKKASALAPEDANTCYQLTSAYAAGGYLNDTNFALHRLEQLNREQAMGLVQSFNIEFVQKLAASEYPDLRNR